jgi:hypothetical protein
MNKPRFVLVHAIARKNAAATCMRADLEGWQVVFSEPKRTDDQNAKFHAMVGDIARQCEWGGKKRKPKQWKVLLISGHAMATREGAEILPGLEGEFVNIRESSALMSIRRGASLITYTQAWGDNQGVQWTEPVAEPA